MIAAPDGRREPPRAVNRSMRHTARGDGAGTGHRGTAQDVQAYLNAPALSGLPSFVLLGGVGGIHPGGMQWPLLTLPPGNRVAACPVVDPATGKPYAAFGMLRHEVS